MNLRFDELFWKKYILILINHSDRNPSILLVYSISLNDRVVSLKKGIYNYSIIQFSRLDNWSTRFIIGEPDVNLVREQRLFNSSRGAWLSLAQPEWLKGKINEHVKWIVYQLLQLEEQLFWKQRFPFCASFTTSLFFQLIRRSRIINEDQRSRKSREKERKIDR